MADERGGGMPPDTSKSTDKVRINVTLSPKSYSELKQAAENSQMDVSQFVRNSLRVYFFLQQEQAAGKNLYIGADGKLEKQVVMP